MGENKVHCWKGKGEYMAETFGWQSDEHLAVYRDGDGTCLLEDGHEEEHEFTPDSETVVSFKP